jgi:hypothetical protein
MSKVTPTPQENGLSGQTPLEPEQKEVPTLEATVTAPQPVLEKSQYSKAQPKTGKSKESKVRRLSQGQELYTPKNRERKTLALLTVEQYLRRAQQDKAISDLIRSLHKTKIMSIADWERETAALLKKKTW